MRFYRAVVMPNNGTQRTRAIHKEHKEIKSDFNTSCSSYQLCGLCVPFFKLSDVS